MFADYVSRSLRRTARRFASPAIPTAKMPINAARSTGIIGNFLLGGRFYGEKNMPKMRLCGASALFDRRRTLEVSVRTMRNDFYFVKREDHVEKIRIRRKILRQRYVQVRFVRLRDAYSRAGGHVHVPAVWRYDAAPVIRGERNDKDWRGGRKPLKAETPKPWSASIGNQTT